MRIRISQPCPALAKQVGSFTAPKKEEGNRGTNGASGAGADVLSVLHWSPELEQLCQAESRQPPSTHTLQLKHNVALGSFTPGDDAFQLLCAHCEDTFRQSCPSPLAEVMPGHRCCRAGL